jgi:K+-sensing histidine kinase KdpD
VLVLPPPLLSTGRPCGTTVSIICALWLRLWAPCDRVAIVEIVEIVAIVAIEAIAAIATRLSSLVAGLVSLPLYRLFLYRP